MKQKLVERTVVGGVVQIAGQYFKPAKPVGDGRKRRFIIFYDNRGVVKSPVYDYTDGMPFQQWKEDKKERCSQGAVES